MPFDLVSSWHCGMEQCEGVGEFIFASQDSSVSTRTAEPSWEAAAASPPHPPAAPAPPSHPHPPEHAEIGVYTGDDVIIRGRRLALGDVAVVMASDAVDFQDQPIHATRRPSANCVRRMVARFQRADMGSRMHILFRLFFHDAQMLRAVQDEILRQEFTRRSIWKARLARLARDDRRAARHRMRALPLIFSRNSSSSARVTRVRATASSARVRATATSSVRVRATASSARVRAAAAVSYASTSTSSGSSSD